MTKEEIIKGGRPSEPYCFETDTEELWYNIGLYDGATAETKSPWVSVKEKLPSPYENVFIAGLAGRCMGVGGVDYVNGEGKWQHYSINCERFREFKDHINSISCCGTDTQVGEKSCCCSKG